MSQGGVAAELADWRARLRLVSSSVVALRESAADRRPRGEGGWPQIALAGVTAALNDLWAHYALFTDVIDRATGLTLQGRRRPDCPDDRLQRALTRPD